MFSQLAGSRIGTEILALKSESAPTFKLEALCSDTLDINDSQGQLVVDLWA